MYSYNFPAIKSYFLSPPYLLALQTVDPLYYMHRLYEVYIESLILIISFLDLLRRFYYHTKSF